MSRTIALPRATFAHTSLVCSASALALLLASSCQGTTAPSVPAEDDSGHARAREPAGDQTPTSRGPNHPNSGSTSNLVSGEREGANQMRAAVPKIERIFANPASTLTCQSDADCTITCKRDGDCCPELCGCSGAINRSSLEELTAHLSKACGPTPICPMPTCAGLKRFAAKCEQGLCTAHENGS